MTTLTIRNQIVAILATVLVSSACLLGAVGPATTGGQGVVASRAI